MRSLVAQLCVAVLLASPVAGQNIVVDKPPQGFVEKITHSYREKEVAPIRLQNSSRLDALIRAGKLYLSLQDTIALTLENNLDIELQRYGPETSKASLMRAQAGGLLRGVPPVVQGGAASAQAQVVGSQTGGAPVVQGGGRRTTADAGGGGTGGTIITATGTALQNLDPVFVSTFNMGHTTRPQSNTVTTGLTSTIFDSTSHSYAVQKSWLTGTTASLGWNNLYSRGNNPLSDINPLNSANIQLQISQRLLQGFGVAVNDRNIRIAKNNMKVSDLQFRNQLITTVAAVVGLYWDLVSYNEDLKVKEQALALAKKLYEDNKKQVEIGTLAPIEIVNAEAQVAAREQDLIVSQTVLLQQETILKNVLSRTGVASSMVADARIVPTDKMAIPDVDPVQPVQDLYAAAVADRPDLEQTRINIENARIGLKGSRSQLLPSLDVQASFQNNALSGAINDLLLRGQPIVRRVDDFFVGGYGTALGQLARRNFPDYSVGFQLNIPLRNRSAQADMIIDTINLRQQELQEQRALNQLRVDIQNSVVALQQTRARYQSALKQRELQEQTLAAEQKKYELGASTVYLIIQYQRDLAQAESNLVSAMSGYQKAKVDLDRVTGQTLKAYNIDVVEAMAGSVSRPPDMIRAQP
ncbi:MAG: TolC family protein [Bryobacteraceae bacterium]